MGLFDVFKKKDCEICGKDVNLFGYKKLEDGEICKDCEKKLSPFFDDRRHSTVEQIKAQLAYREENERALHRFNYSVVIGSYQKMYIELQGGVPTRFVISSATDYKAGNPDIISFKDIASCTPDIRESRSEEKYTNDKGERVSYNPPRYEYSYDFNIRLTVSGCPYFDDIRVNLNSGNIELKTVMGNQGGIGGLFRQQNQFDPMLYPEYREYKAMVDDICQYVSFGQRGVPYAGINNMNSGNGFSAIGAAVAGVVNAQTQNQYAQTAHAQSPVQNTGWTCPACGTENTGNFCQSCGSKKPEPKAQNASWTCFCGTQNTSKFCQNCGQKQFDIGRIWCSECSWTAEPGDTVVPTFCPNCDKRFDENDLR